MGDVERLVVFRRVQDVDLKIQDWLRSLS